MTTFTDLLKDSPFSPELFMQTIKKQQEKNSQLIGGYYIIVAIICILFGAWISYDHTKQVMIQLHIIPHQHISDIVAYICSSTDTLGLYIGIAIAATLLPIFFLGLLGSIIVQVTDNMENTEINKWLPQYKTAWNSHIEPQMIQSITHFQHLTDKLSDTEIASNEYASMYKLSEQVKNTINNGPVLYPNTNFDITPTFVELNTKMEAYNAKHIN